MSSTMKHGGVTWMCGVLPAAVLLIAFGCGEAPTPPAAAQGKAVGVAAAPVTAKAVQTEPELDEQIAAVRVGKSTQIVMRRDPMTDADLARVAEYPQVTSIRMNRSAVTDKGVAELTKLPRLEMLRLSAPLCTDAGLAAVGRITSLRHLIIEGVPITDAGLEHLRSLKNLESLYVIDTKVTEPGLAKLREAIPALHIHQ